METNKEKNCHHDIHTYNLYYFHINTHTSDPYDVQKWVTLTYLSERLTKENDILYTWLQYVLLLYLNQLWHADYAPNLLV